MPAESVEERRCPGSFVEPPPGFRRVSDYQSLIAPGARRNDRDRHGTRSRGPDPVRNRNSIGARFRRGYARHRVGRTGRSRKIGAVLRPIVGQLPARSRNTQIQRAAWIKRASSQTLGNRGLIHRRDGDHRRAARNVAIRARDLHGVAPRVRLSDIRLGEGGRGADRRRPPYTTGRKAAGVPPASTVRVRVSPTNSAFAGAWGSVKIVVGAFPTAAPYCV